MLDISLKYIVNELENYLRKDDGVHLPQVVMGNIAMMDSEGQSAEISDKIVVSLVNIEEESTLKNNTPAVCLNLYLLISANYGNDKYETGLSNLSKVIAYFQANKVINPLVSPLPGYEDITSFELNMDLFALSFEQVNYVWGSLGGKQVPFVLYKCRMIIIKGDKAQRSAKLIEQANSNEKVF